MFHLNYYPFTNLLLYVALTFIEENNVIKNYFFLVVHVQLYSTIPLKIAMNFNSLRIFISFLAFNC